MIDSINHKITKIIYENSIDDSEFLKIRLGQIHDIINQLTKLVEIKNMVDKNNIVGEDMICPITKKHCDDECCTVGSECNMSGDNLEKPDEQ